MASFQLTLPDDLAEQAAEFGLLDPSAIADLLRAEIRRQIMHKISAGIASLESSDEVPMSEEDVQAEVRVVRDTQRVPARA
ncbi:hypothetical protein [Pseudoduganella violacea]|uniref:CopG family transcriptional regulator n=1 Tax=Pseudoduganella violacea TaxID=1715466 RepID=A0A7W5FSB0_9BURK|nr:hypothetical protein [Pseudoduganella violacea]MBB3117023.1 hypothetical protein [Pseudoduganella violacea]